MEREKMKGGKKRPGITHLHIDPHVKFDSSVYVEFWMIGIDFNRVPQRKFQILYFLIASAFTIQINPDILQRWQVPQAHAKTTIVAGDFSRLPHGELDVKSSEARHCPMLKHYGPYKSPEPAACQAWERTSTNNKSSKDSEILMVYLQIKIPESWPVVAPSWR